MRLGDHFLAPGAARQAPVRPVKFKAVNIGPSGEQMAADCEAVLAFVSETERAQATADAHKELREQWKDITPPPAVVEQEIGYHILFRSLRDNTDQSYKMRFADNVKQLKNALVSKSALELYTDYSIFVAEEFPDRIDVETYEQLVKDAESKSLAVLLSEREFSLILRALASLAARFGKSATQT